MILLHFRTLSDNQLSEKVFLHGCQRFIPFACRPILRMNFVLKKNLHFFRTLSDQFWQCGKFLSAGLSKLHFTCRYDQFDGTFFLSKKCFLSVSDIGQKISGWLSNFLNAEIESSFYVPNGLVWRKTTFFLEKSDFLILSGHWATFNLLEKVFPRVFSKLHSTCPWEPFDEI